MPIHLRYLGMPPRTETVEMVAQILETSHLFALRYAEEFKLLKEYCVATQVLLGQIPRSEEFDLVYCNGLEFITGAAALVNIQVFEANQLEMLCTNVVFPNTEMRGILFPSNSSFKLNASFSFEHSI